MNKCCNRRTPTQRNQTELALASSKAYLEEKNSLHLLQVFPLAEKQALGESFHGQLHPLFRNSIYFHLTLSSFSFWSLWGFPWAAHTCQFLVWQVQISCDVGAKAQTWLCRKPAQGSPWLWPQLQGLISFLHTSGESSPIIWDHSRQTRFSCSLTIPAAFSLSEFSVLFLNSGLTWYSSVLYICRAIVCNGISWSVGFLS